MYEKSSKYFIDDCDFINVHDCTAQSDVTVTLDGNGIFFPNAKPFIDKQIRVLRLLLGDVKLNIIKTLIIKN